MVPRAAVEQALEAEPASHEEVVVHQRAERTALTLFLAGMGTALTSIAALGIWTVHDTDSRAPWAMLAPLIGGFGMTVTGVVLGVHGESHWRRAIDDYNEVAAANGRCPP